MQYLELVAINSILVGGQLGATADSRWTFKRRWAGVSIQSGLSRRASLKEAHAQCFCCSFGTNNSAAPEPSIQS